jgi:geranylgeranylglycerol-phosphate geranylgeranyltransferase
MNYLLKVYAFISLIRVVNVLITFFSVIVAAVICSDISLINGNIFTAAACAALAAAAGNVINDIWDYESDLINRPDRPIPSGKVTKKAALNFYYTLVLISVMIAASFNLIIFFIVILSHLLLLLYTVSLKKISLLGNFVISFLTGFVFIYGGIIVGDISAAIIPAGFALLINFSREVIKTIGDIPGDKSTGTITFPQKYGINYSRKLISVFLILLLIFTFVPFVTRFYGIEYFIIVMVVVNPLLIYVIKSLLETDRTLNLNKLSFILKLNMIFGLTAIYFGK